MFEEQMWQAAGREAARAGVQTFGLDPAVRRFRLAVYCPRGDDGTSLVRAMGPLAAMERDEARFELVLPKLGVDGQELTWDWLARCDALFLQRPWLRLHAQLAVQAQMMGVPVWVDWDDDYLAIHPSNPHYAQFTYEGVEEVLQQLVELADVVTVTTAELKRRIEERRGQVRRGGQQVMEVRGEEGGGRREKVRVIPNACQWPMTEGERRRRVTWRGGASHQMDVLSVLGQLSQVSRLPQFGRWEWHFLGDVPWQVADAIPAEQLVSGFGAEPWLYMEALGRLAPWVHIVPLADCAFNRCKSNLAWLEATAAGAVVLAPDWEEWRRPGVVTYKGASDFGQKLREVMGSYPGRVEMHPGVAEGRRFIQEFLGLEKVNQLRWEIVNELGRKRKGSDA